MLTEFENKCQQQYKINVNSISKQMSTIIQNKC